VAKITTIKIKNLFGITEFEADSKSIELLGGNGTGKTSVLDAIRYALTNRSSRSCIVKNGATEGEIIIETDAGLSITRKPRTNKSDYKSIKQDNKEVQSPEAFLAEIFSELQLNPVAFINMDAKEQNRIILDLIEYHWDLNTIREWFGEIPQGVDYEKHILEVLAQIADEKGFYFQQRQDINRKIRFQKELIKQTQEELPENFNGEKWEKYDLQAIHTQIEQARQHNAQIEKAFNLKTNYDNKIRGFQADKEMKLANLKQTLQDEKTARETEIARLKEQLKAAEEALFNIGDKFTDKSQIIEKEFEAAVAQFNEELKAFEPYLQQAKINILPLQEEADTALKMKQQLPQYNKMMQMNKELADLQAASDEFTRKIELARTLPATILAEANMPLGEMSIDGDQVLIKKPNGELPISNLSEGEKLDLCVDIALKNKSGLQIVLIDGVEKLSPVNRQHLYDRCKASGLQFIATRTTDDSELTVVEL
jgi:exonuclease SbcC